MSPRPVLFPLLVAGLAIAPCLTTNAHGSARPPARNGHPAVYDMPQDRMLVFGGSDGFDGVLGDLWALQLSGSTGWVLLQPAGAPPPARAFHTAVYDALRDRIIVFGGLDDSGPRQDLWALSLGDAPEWTALTAAGAPPSERYQHSAVYDTELRRMVVFGGTNIFSLRADAWVLSFAHPVVPVWSQIQTSGPAPPRRRRSPDPRHSHPVHEIRGSPRVRWN